MPIKDFEIKKKKKEHTEESAHGSYFLLENRSSGPSWQHGCQPFNSEDRLFSAAPGVGNMPTRGLDLRICKAKSVNTPSIGALTRGLNVLTSAIRRNCSILRSSFTSKKGELVLTAGQPTTPTAHTPTC